MSCNAAVTMSRQQIHAARAIASVCQLLFFDSCINKKGARMMAATILIVEDQPSIAELMELHLRAAGYTVAIAEDAIVAGKMILNARPDLLLVDVSLPYMTGYDFVATLIADQTIPHIPTIFI